MKNRSLRALRTLRELAGLPTPPLPPPQQEHDMTDLDDGADLRAVMDRSLRDLDAPDHCGPAALAAGRRIRDPTSRDRHRSTGVAAVAAVTALVTCRASVAAPSDADRRSPTRPDVVARPVQRTVDRCAPTGRAGWWTMPATAWPHSSRRTCPRACTVETVDTTVRPGARPGARGSSAGSCGTLSASTGPGAIQIILYPPERERPDAVAAACRAPSPSRRGRQRTATPGTDDRRAHHTANPSRLPRLHRELHGADRRRRRADRPVLSTAPSRGRRTSRWSLLGPDGGALYFYVADSTGEKPGYEAPSAEAPPLTLDQLRTLAEDPVWTSYQP